MAMQMEKKDLMQCRKHRANLAAEGIILYTLLRKTSQKSLIFGIWMQKYKVVQWAEKGK